jgi:hypothetical protein
MAIIVNDGVRLPIVDLERLDLAAGTPYETDMKAAPEPQRVLALDVARTVLRALSSVVSEGGNSQGRQRRLPHPGRQAAAGRRQDRNRRQPIRERRPADLAAGGRSHRHLRVLPWEPVLWHDYRLRAGGGGSRISVFERARGTLVTSAQTRTRTAAPHGAIKVRPRPDAAARTGLCRKK